MKIWPLSYKNFIPSRTIFSASGQFVARFLCEKYVCKLLIFAFTSATKTKLNNVLRLLYWPNTNKPSGQKTSFQRHKTSLRRWDVAQTSYEFRITSCVHLEITSNLQNFSTKSRQLYQILLLQVLHFYLFLHTCLVRKNLWGSSFFVLLIIFCSWILPKVWKCLLDVTKFYEELNLENNCFCIFRGCESLKIFAEGNYLPLILNNYFKFSRVFSLKLLSLYFSDITFHKQWHFSHSTTNGSTLISFLVFVFCIFSFLVISQTFFTSHNKNILIKKANHLI